MTDFQQIAFDQKTYDRQSRYNKDYAAHVNGILQELHKEIDGLTEQDTIDFLSNPQTLTERLENKDFEEYCSYIATLPKSVASSMKFHCEKGDIIKRLHAKLPQPTSYFFKINCCKIQGEQCIFDEQALKEKCTISGSPETLKAWQQANEIADALNKLEKALKKLHPDMKAVESVVSLDMGLIRSTSEGYVADLDRLKQMI